MKATRIILAAAAAALMASPVLAADDAASTAATAKVAPAKVSSLEAKWTKLDADKDGSITKDEWTKKRSAKKFDRLDTDHDGKISQDEWMAQKKHMAKNTVKPAATPAKASDKTAAPAEQAPAAGSDSSGGTTAQ